MQPSLFLLCIVSEVAKLPLCNLMYNFKQSFRVLESGKVDIDHCFGTRQVNILAKYKNLNLKITRDYDLQENSYILPAVQTSFWYSYWAPTRLGILFVWTKFEIYANIPEIQWTYSFLNRRLKTAYLPTKSSSLLQLKSRPILLSFN